ncbi:dienelactone hydrolase family protein [bacterium]|nr:dienelactone hydrolase family protein [bacterium]
MKFPKAFPSSPLFTFCLVVATLISPTAKTKSIDYKSGKESYEGYVVNKGKKAPTIFLIHDWDGLTEYEVKRSEMLGELGYSVFAIDLFGKGVRPEKIEDRRQHTGELYKDRVKMRKLMNDALVRAKSEGLNVKNAMAIGYCFGGAAALEWARSGAKLKGFATFHGGLETPEGQSYKDTKAKLLVYHGGADTAITMDQFATLANELEKNKVPNEMMSFGGAPHAFTVYGSDRYQENADKKSWAHFTSAAQEILK